MQHISNRTLVAAAVMVLAGAAGAAGPPRSPLETCATDAVVSGAACMDKYEASVWRVPHPTRASGKLVAKIRQGLVTPADLATGGATQLGIAGDDYAPCADSGQNCVEDIYAVSILGVTPSASITWFQAQQSCTNSGKRLPSNAEWQAAVAGTPDPGPDDGTTDCNSFGDAATLTGSRSRCVSARGAFDMVGNLFEWVADWTPRSTACGAWSAGVSPTGDEQCLAGAAESGEPGAIVRGGDFLIVSFAGPLAIEVGHGPSVSFSAFGFRCVR